MKKSIQLFFVPEDERRLSETLQDAIVDLAVVDGKLWNSTEPPLVRTIADATDEAVLLWHRALVPTLPVVPAAGRFHGPSSGVVIQLYRSRIDGDTLLSGAMSFGANDPTPEMVAFVNAVWKATKALSTNALETMAGERVTNYWIGREALNWLRVVSRRCLRDRAVRTAYLVPSSVATRAQS